MPAVLVLMVLNYFFISVRIPYIGFLVERLALVVLAVALYKLLSWEAARYRAVLATWPSTVPVNPPMIRLGVNIDHVATVRQARRAKEPDPVAAAVLAILGGADGITVHLREDRRHIQDRDVHVLRETVTDPAEPGDGRRPTRSSRSP